MATYVASRRGGEAEGQFDDDEILQREDITSVYPGLKRPQD